MHVFYLILKQNVSVSLNIGQHTDLFSGSFPSFKML